MKVLGENETPRSGGSMKGSHSVATARLYLRTITREDTAIIVRWRSEPDNYRYFRNPYALTSEGHLSWFDNQYSADENRLDWLCVEKESGQAVGVFGLIRKDGRSVEISYLLDKSAQGRGYAAEAVNGLLAYAKDRWKANKAIAEVHRDNLASQHFADRNGFVPQIAAGDFIIYVRMI